MVLHANRSDVKVGAFTWTNCRGGSDLRSFDRRACVFADIQIVNCEGFLVSSGAVAPGMNRLCRKMRPRGYEAESDGR